MFDRFNDRAKTVIALAQEEARAGHHNYIGTEHILLGLIREGEGVAAQALLCFNITLDSARQHVEEIVGQSQKSPEGIIPYTSRAHKVLLMSDGESRKLGHPYIGTEHILIALIREGVGVGAQVLYKLTGDLSEVYRQVLQILTGPTLLDEINVLLADRPADDPRWKAALAALAPDLPAQQLQTALRALRTE